MLESVAERDRKGREGKKGERMRGGRDKERRGQ